MFSPGSRYSSAGQPYQVLRPDGRQVLATPLPLPRQHAPLRGYHPRGGAERLDLLAFSYLNDATAFWQICDANNAMVAGTLAARDLIAIPEPGA